MKASVLRRLAALNLPPEAMAEVLSIFAEAAEAEESRLAGQRDRKRRSRLGHVTVTGQERDCHSDTSPLDPPPITPPYNPPSHPSDSSNPRDVPPPREKRASRKAETPRATRIPDDWQPDREAARALGVPDGKIDWIAARFRDFWRGKAGKDGVKSDWKATWRNWCRNDAERNGWAPTNIVAVATGPPPGMVWIDQNSREWDERSADCRRSGQKMKFAIKRADGKEGNWFPIAAGERAA